MPEKMDPKVRADLQSEAARPAHELDEMAEMRRQYAELTLQYQDMAAQMFDLLRTNGNVAVLPPEETPLYEVGDGGYYSPDDILYPPGAQFEDVTGLIVPNENMFPLNRPAEERMSRYLAGLPLGAKTPPLDVVIQAAWESLPKAGEDPSTIAANKANVVRKALEMHYAQMGLRAEEIPTRNTTVQRAPQNVPIMSNTKITGVGTPARRYPSTRLHAAPVDAASKPASVMGTVHSRPLGQPMQGARAL